jgi:hypothetical protein
VNLVVAVVLVVLAALAAVGLIGWWIDASADGTGSSDDRDDSAP